MPERAGEGCPRCGGSDCDWHRGRSKQHTENQRAGLTVADHATTTAKEGRL